MAPPMACERRGVCRASGGPDPAEHPAGGMVAERPADLDGPPACDAEPQTEVDVFGPETGRPVETADGVEGVAAKHLARADAEPHVPPWAAPLPGGGRVEMGSVQAA